MHQIERRRIHGDVLRSERGDGSGRGIHAGEVNMNLPVTVEGGGYGECRGQLTTCGVHKYADLGIGIGSQRGQHGFGVEVRAAHVAFEMEMILSHWADVFVISAAKVHLYYIVRKDRKPLCRRNSRGAICENESDCQPSWNLLSSSFIR